MTDSAVMTTLPDSVATDSSSEGSIMTTTTTPRRGKPYIWVTWLTGYLADEKLCAWAPWFRAHFQAPKVINGTFNLDAWKSQHGKQRRARREWLEFRGFVVAEEVEVKLSGATALLAGKIDLIAIKRDNAGAVVEAQIWDEKTGQQRGSDYWQVLTYLFALPFQMPEVTGKLTGFVGYASGEYSTIHQEELDEVKRKDIIEAIRVVGGVTAPEKSPTFSECSFCDITESDCPAKVKEGALFANTSEF